MKNLVLLLFCFCPTLILSKKIDSQNLKFKTIANKNLKKNIKSKKAILKQKYQELEEQHMVVMVLAKQYNKEYAQLRSFESLFCNYFDLDVEKWRKNLYIWDSISESFLERNIQKASSSVKNDRKQEKKQ